MILKSDILNETSASRPASAPWTTTERLREQRLWELSEVLSSHLRREQSDGLSSDLRREPFGGLSSDWSREQCDVLSSENRREQSERSDVPSSDLRRDHRTPSSNRLGWIKFNINIPAYLKTTFSDSFFARTCFNVHIFVIYDWNECHLCVFL